MNPNRCRVVLRARSPLEVFDLTLVFVRENRSLFIKLWAILLAPFAVVTLPLCWFLEGHAALLLLPLILMPFVQAPFTLAGGTLLFQEQTTVGEVAGQCRKASGAFFGRLVLGVLGVVTTLCTFGYGVFLVMPALLYISETSLLERVGVERGIKRSLRLAGGNIPVAVAGAVGQVFLTVWMAFVFDAAGTVLLSTTLQLGTPFGSVLAGQVTPFFLWGMLAAQPLQALYRLLLYVDVRTRIEGWDLQVSLRAAGLAREGKRT